MVHCDDPWFIDSNSNLISTVYSDFRRGKNLILRFGMDYYLLLPSKTCTVEKVTGELFKADTDM